MQQFPSITEEEFRQGCQAFYETAARAPDSAAALQLAFHHDVLSIRKEYLVGDPDLSGRGATDTAQNECDELTDDEDHEILSKPLQSSGKDTILVEFSVLRSSIYQVPVLWFTLNGVPSNVLAGIEAVYQHLVPETTRSCLRQISVMGGISMANHPISDLPAFFIHPCNTAEALEETCQDRSCSPEVYLLVWFGLIGPSVNLYVPSQLLLGDAEDKAQAP